MAAAMFNTPVAAASDRAPRSIAALVAAALATAALATAAPAAATERLISIGGAVTEIVYALGAEGDLVARDSTSSYPPEVQALPDVGYMRRLSAEPMLTVDPTLVLAGGDAGPDTALEQLEAAGVQIARIADDPTPAGVAAKMQAVGEALGKGVQGRALADGFRAEHKALAEAISAHLETSTRPRVLFVLSVGAGRPALAAGKDTSASNMIALAGGENAIEGFDGYKPLNAESTIAAAPDVLLVTRRTLELIGGIDKLLAMPSLAQTPAGASRRVIAMDGLLLLGFGPRTNNAIRELAAQLHPSLAD